MRRTLRNWLWNYALRHWYGAGPCWEGKITPEIMEWGEKVFDEDYKNAAAQQ